MDLTSPLGSLIPTLDAAVLEVLAETPRPLGVSQIQRLTRRGARSGVHRVLARLLTEGLVTAHATNLGSVYELNRDHLLAPAVMAAAQVRTELFERLTTACAALEPAVLAAAVYGATARRESGPESPVELFLIVGDDHVISEEWDRQLRRLDEQVRSWTGNRLERLVLTEQHLQQVDAREPIVEAWDRDAIILVGRRTFDLPSARG